jgi:DNA-binding transcriptional ArsR family regulator
MDGFTALADPRRRDILEVLARGECAAGEIGKHFPISAPAVSQHLKTLRQSGLVRVRVEGQRRIYSLDPNGFAAMDQWLARMRHFWAGRLDALEHALEEGESE